MTTAHTGYKNDTKKTWETSLSQSEKTPSSPAFLVTSVALVKKPQWKKKMLMAARRGEIWVLFNSRNRLRRKRGAARSLKLRKQFLYLWSLKPGYYYLNNAEAIIAQSSTVLLSKTALYLHRFRNEISPPPTSDLYLISPNSIAVVFPRFRQFVCILSSHCLFKVFSFLLIGCCDYFRSDFTILNRKAP